VGYEVAISADRTAADLSLRPHGQPGSAKAYYCLLSWCGDTVSLCKDWKMNEYRELVKVHDREIQNYSERCLLHFSPQIPMNALSKPGTLRKEGDYMDLQ